MIAATVLAVLAALGPMGRVVPALTRGELTLNAALITQIVFIVLAVALIVINVKAMRSKK